ncbi:MAG TPA: heme o synthase [Thermoanaerobaculia bacterium]|nr:heme o synthase [Thermoanaerobaculia bacterium]
MTVPARSAEAPPVPRRIPALSDWLALSKARIVAMVLVTAAAGYGAAAPRFRAGVFAAMLAGTALLAAGTNAFNELVERDRDARMARTRRRPIPAGRISPAAAGAFAGAAAAAGAVVLAVFVHPLAAALGLFTLASYVLAYTPLKRTTTACTIVGAVPGAIPPLIGWTAATGGIHAGGALLFAILFFWQMPHFLALSWIHRRDYAAAGFSMTSVRDASGAAVSFDALLHTGALLAVTAAATLLSGGSRWPFAIAAVAGSALLGAAIRFRASRTPARARALFAASNAFLPAAMAAIVLSGLPPF